jgi:hypothetical protein
MNIVIDEEKIMEARVLTQRAEVLSDTLVNGYFDQDVESRKDYWKLAGGYYENAKIITETILSLVCNARKLIDKGLDEFLTENE